jgi:hypothetical protein
MGGYAGWLGDEDLEGQLGQGPGRHDDQVLALDQILDLTEQAFVERMGAYSIEGQTACRSPEPDLDRCR